MTTKKELLDHEDARRREIDARFAELRVDDWDTPGATGDWTPKDVLAHIASWHAYAVDRLEELRSTGKFTRLAREIDEFNHELYERCKDVTLHDAKVMSGSTRHRFREEVAALTEPIDDATASMVRANGSEHYDEHIPLLDKFLESR